MSAVASRAASSRSGIEPHGDEVRRRFRPRPSPSQVLPDDELECPGKRGLERGAIDLAVALTGMAIAGREERPGHVHGQIQCRARDELLVVEIAAVPSGRPAADSADERWRRHAKVAEERLQRHLDTRRERGDVGGEVEGNDPAVLHRERGWQRSAAGGEPIDRERLGDLDVRDANFEHVAGVGAADVDRPDQPMSARAAVL